MTLFRAILWGVTSAAMAAACGGADTSNAFVHSGGSGDDGGGGSDATGGGASGGGSSGSGTSSGAGSSSGAASSSGGKSSSGAASSSGGKSSSGGSSSGATSSSGAASSSGGSSSGGASSSGASSSGASSSGGPSDASTDAPGDALAANCLDLHGYYTMTPVQEQGCGSTFSSSASECIKQTVCTATFSSRTLDGGVTGISGTAFIKSDGSFTYAALKEGGSNRTGCTGTWDEGTGTLTVDCGGVDSGQSCLVTLTRTGNPCP